MAANNNTIFDDVFRTMIEKMPELVIPLINEVFGTDYPADIPIIQRRNEHQAEDGETITDSRLLIENKLYHIECQSTSDSNMIIRMMEYDFAIAMDEIQIWEGKLYMEFPNSCVLYLRGTKDPEFLTMVIAMPDGRKIDYKVPVIRVQSYTRDEIFQKKLIFLLPYYIMRYEKNKEQADTDNIFLEKLLAEYAEIENYLEEELLDQGQERLYRNMIELIGRIADYIFADKQNVRKELNGIMGGKVLELETDKLISQGRELGLKQGEANGRKAESCKIALKMLQKGVYSIKEICEMTELTEKEVQELEKQN